MSKHRITQVEDYEPLVGRETVERIREKARKFKDLRVANFNSTYYGGGVAEMISSLTLLMNSLGLRTEWRVIQGTADFFSITKKMHNALQGGKIDLSGISSSSAPVFSMIGAILVICSSDNRSCHCKRFFIA